MIRENPSLIEYIATHEAKRLNDIIQFVGVVLITVVFGLGMNSIYAYPLTGIVMISVTIEYIGYRYRRRLRVSDRIEARLQSLNRLLDYEDDQKVRFTYHSVVNRLVGKNKLRQEIDYICQYNESRSGAGRFFDIDKGLIGEAYRIQDTVVYNCFSQEDCFNMLTEEQGYSKKEAREQIQKRSYLAYPIVDGATNNVHGVVFFESQRPKTFPESNNSRTLPDQRAMNRANVDGYAVRSEDVSGNDKNPSFLESLDITQDSIASDMVLEPGTCVRISWGEVLPRRADAVVSESGIEVENRGIHVPQSISEGHNVDYNTKKIIRTCREIKGDVLSANI